MSVSMVIAAQNQAPLLHKTLQSVMSYTPPSEIVVVDLGTDDTEMLCRQWRLRTRAPVAYTQGPNQPTVQNPEVMFLDPGTLFMSDVVSQLTHARRSYRNSVVCAEYCLEDTHEGCELSQCRLVSGAGVSLWRREWLRDVDREKIPIPNVLVRRLWQSIAT